MSTESKNKWRRLHELCLRVKEAKDFETLGAVVEELSELKTAEGDAAKFGNSQCFSAISNAYIAAWKKLGQWQENPPPIAPQETQIGPGNPFPPPPPPPTVAQGGWTGGLVFERIAPKGLTNPVGYRAATPEEQAELDRVARAINRNMPLFEPTPQAQGSLDALKADILRETVKCFGVNTPDVGPVLNDLYAYIEKAFARHAAQNAKAIESAAEPDVDRSPLRAETPGETLYKILQRVDAHDSGSHAPIYGWPMVNAATRAYYERAAEWMFDVCRSKAVERAAEPVRTPEPWTGESLYLAADMQLMEAPGDWTTLTSFQQKLWMLAASAANERMGSAPSPLKPWTAEEFYLQFGQPLGRVGIVTSVRLSSAQREACEKAAAVINKWAGLVS